MLGRPGSNDLWGKLRSVDGQVTAWHPLGDHSTDVACVLEALLAQATIRRRLARAAGRDELDPVTVARLCWLAFVHDLGKCAHGFQAKAGERPQRTCGHLAALRPLFDGDELTGRFLEAIDAAALAGWGDTAVDELLAATFAHHGAPVRLEFNAAEDHALLASWQPAGDLDPLRRVTDLAALGRAAFPAAFAAGDPLPANPAFHHLFAGLLMLADWLGSGAEPDLFPFAEVGDGPRASFARERAPLVLRRIGLDVGGLVAALQPSARAFEGQFGFPPRPLQEEIDRLELPGPGGIVLLEAETGSGKTEAALRWAYRLFAAGRVDGAYFAVPLRSAAVQLHRRMNDWLARTFGEGRAEALLAVPGYLRVGEAQGQALPDHRVQWIDDPTAGRRLERWAAEEPKRYLAHPFAVGTVDQALLGVLKVRHAHLRAACLVRHLLIVDEVHASDRYTGRLVRQLLELFRACGGQVLLMSATLGSDMRSYLLSSSTRPPRLAAAEAAPYPLLSAAGGPYPIRHNAGVKRVVAATIPEIADPAAIATRAADAVDAGARVLVLRNTVGAAIETVSALEERLGTRHEALFRVNGVPTLHHGRFAAEDRRLLDEAIERRFGKDSPAGPAVVVATQTVEQSLDVDFDLLVTDLCPIDVLLQRIGRLHRHQRPRPATCEQARVLVLGPADGDLTLFLASRRHGFGKDRAYRDVRTVEATRGLIGPGAVWTIPTDNRRLVERGTHPEALREIARVLGGPWPRHGTEVDGTSMAQGGQAADGCVDVAEPFSALRFAAEHEGRIGTRLGLDDLLLPLDAPFVSPFGAKVERLRLPAWMIQPETWAMLACEDEPSLRSHPDGTIGIGDQRFVYDRLGLRMAAG